MIPLSSWENCWLHWHQSSKDLCKFSVPGARIHFFFFPVSILLRFSLDNYHLLTFSGWAPSKRIRYTHGFYPVWLSSGLKKSHLLEDALTLSERTGVMRQSSQWEKPPERGARKPLQVSLKRVPRGHNHLFLSSLSCFHISPFQLPSFIITIITSPLPPYIALAWQSLRSQSNNLPIFACIPAAEHLWRGKNTELVDDHFHLEIMSSNHTWVLNICSVFTSLF